MRSNTFGRLFSVTTFGESHGACIGAVIDGCPAGVPLNEAIIDAALAARFPTGGETFFTTRREADKSSIVAGVFNGMTTGAPVAVLIPNDDTRSADYEALKDVFRPGHADFTYYAKYKTNDYRGGGRSSGRETAARVAAGAVAKQFLAPLGIDMFAHVLRIGTVSAERIVRGEEMKNPFRCADKDAAAKMDAFLNKVKTKRDSAGGVAELRIANIPAGLGEPVFDKLEARLAYAVMGIGAVRGVEIGDGFAAAGALGSANNDEMDGYGFLSNHAGGTLGGISTGQEVVLRAAVKPVPTVGIKQRTIRRDGGVTEIECTGRHDICIVPRVVPVIEAMAWLVLADMVLLSQNNKI